MQKRPIHGNESPLGDAMGLQGNLQQARQECGWLTGRTLCGAVAKAETDRSSSMPGDVYPGAL
jgi:hypothetical protein